MATRGKGKDPGENPGVPLRRSSRERKHHSYGSDFVEDDPELKTPPAKPVPSRRAAVKPVKTPAGQKLTPGAEPDPLPPGRNPDPPPKTPKTVTWPADEEHWKEPTLPRNHSKRFRFIRKRLECFRKRPAEASSEENFQ